MISNYENLFKKQLITIVNCKGLSIFDFLFKYLDHWFGLKVLLMNKINLLIVFLK